MLRRMMLICALPMLMLGGCAQGSGSATSLEVAKTWGGAIANALVAASANYAGPQMATVQAYATQLQKAAADFQQLGDVTTARSAATSLIEMAEQLVPLLVKPDGSSLLGPAAVYVSMGLSVVHTFIAALPPPPDVPPTPPAALSRFGHR